MIARTDMCSTLLLGLVSLLILAGIGACGERIVPASAPGTSFPTTPLTSLVGTELLQPEALRGKALVINFWATWCEPCRKEMPSLESLHQQTDPSKLAVLGVSVDADLNLAREFLLQYELKFANFTDPEQKVARDALKIQAFPVTFLVAPDGMIKARITGARDWGSPDMLRMLEDTLATRVGLP